MNYLATEVDGRVLRFDLSTHFKQRAIARKISPDVVTDALRNGVVIQVGGSITKAMRLGDALSASHRVGPFPLLQATAGSFEHGTRLLVWFRPVGAKAPIHVALAVCDDQMVALTCYTADTTSDWHPTGLTSRSAWDRYGKLIESSFATWRAARQLAA